MDIRPDFVCELVLLIVAADFVRLNELLQVFVIHSIQEELELVLFKVPANPEFAQISLQALHRAGGQFLFCR